MHDTQAIKNEHINDSGWLEVGNGHKIYWVDWGNPTLTQPIFYLHGGPGGGFSETSFEKFDPIRHRVIFHDQRGSSRSTPFASTKHNTTADLLHDITKLKDYLGFQTISLYGFSWGSTLALLYAIANPTSIDTMLIGGIFLARSSDDDYYLRGGVASHFPEVWQEFRQLAPTDTPDAAVADYYKTMLEAGDTATRQKFATAWLTYESSLLRLDYQPAKVAASLADFASPSLAYLEAHYILNHCFIAENYIIDHAASLRHINRIAIVQGRYDFICPPQAAYDLYHAIDAPNTSLQLVESGHSGSDTVQRQVIHAYTMSLW